MSVTTIHALPPLVPIPCRWEDCHAGTLSSDPDATYTCPEHEGLRGYEERWQ